MTQHDKIITKMALIIIYSLILCVVIEGAANFYLWNMTHEKVFVYFASVNQMKEKYGIDYLVQDVNYGGKVLFDPHPYLIYANAPNYHEVNNQHNSMGYRGEEFEQPKPDGIYRIVTIGGSTTYGVGVTDDFRQSYPYQLQEYLQANGFPQVEVINAGVPGYTSHESFINLQMRVLTLNPDLIIIYHGINDAHARLVYPYSQYRADNIGYRGPIIQDTVMPNIWEYSTFLRILGIQSGWINSHNTLEWTRVRDAWSSYAGAFATSQHRGGYPDGIFQEASAMDMIVNNPPIYFESNLRSMADLAHARGVDVMFSTFAYDPNTANQPTVSTPEYILMLDQHNEVTKAVAETTDSYLFDLTSVMPMGQEYFADGRHMTELGNHIRAEYYGDYIIESILPSSIRIDR